LLKVEVTVQREDSSFVGQCMECYYKEEEHDSGQLHLEFQSGAEGRFVLMGSTSTEESEYLRRLAEKFKKGAMYRLTFSSDSRCLETISDGTERLYSL
jgi:hypothetical protein